MPLRSRRARQPWRLARLLVTVVLSGIAWPPAAARPLHGAARVERDSAQLLRDGDAALSQKNYAAASRAFSEFYRQTLQAQGLYRLGLLAFAEGRLLAAQDLLRRFLADSHFESVGSAAEATEAQRILALPPLPHAKVSVTGAQGALVSLDGRLVGALPLSRPLLVAPGKRTLAISDGARRQEEEIDVAVGRFFEVAYARSSAALLSTELPGILVFEQYAGLPASAAAPLGQAIEDTLQGERLAPLPLEVALAGQTSLRSCVKTPTCQLQLAQKNELDYVLIVHITQVVAGAPWRLRLELTDVELGVQAASSEQECTGCDVTKAAAVLTSSLPLLVAEARRRPHGELEVSSTPAGAEVRLAGRSLGTTPLTRSVWSGQLELAVALPGYAPQRRTLELAAGRKAVLAVTLLPEVVEPAPAPLLAPAAGLRPSGRRPRWRLALGGTALGTGALLIGFGAGAFAANGSCIDTPANPLALCNQIYSTFALGTGLVVAGGVLLLSGGVLLALPSRQPARPAHPSQ